MKRYCFSNALQWLKNQFQVGNEYEKKMKRKLHFHVPCISTLHQCWGLTLRSNIVTLLHHPMYLVKYALKWYVLWVWRGKNVALSPKINWISIFARWNRFFLFIEHCRPQKIWNEIWHKTKICIYLMILEMQYMQ